MDSNVDDEIQDAVNRFYNMSWAEASKFDEKAGSQCSTSTNGSASTHTKERSVNPCTTGTEDMLRKSHPLTNTISEGESCPAASKGATKKANFVELEKVSTYLQNVKLQEHHWQDLHDCLDKFSHEDLKEALKERYGDMENTLLHFVCSRCPPVDVVERLLRLSPGTALYANSDGMLPLHIACRYKASRQVVEILCKYHPAAIALPDKSGRVPLHHVFVGYKNNSESRQLQSCLQDSLERKGARKSFVLSLCQEKDRIISGMVVTDVLSPTIVKLTSARDVVALQDSNRKTPIGMFASASLKIRPRDRVGKRKATRILQLLLDCEPEGDENVMTALQKLPDDLREEALAHSHVKHMLNEKTAAPIFAFGVILDIFIQVLLIAAFWFSTQISRRDSEDGVEDDLVSKKAIAPLAILVLGASYLFLRAIVAMYSYSRIGHFKEWVTNPWNWLEVTNIVLVLLSATLLINFPDDLPDHVNLVVVTGGLQWLALLKILKSTYIAFSVFVTGVLHVFKKMIPFIITTMVLLGSFSFMYYISNYDTEYCKTFLEKQMERGDSEFTGEAPTFCTPYNSFLWSYSLFVGGGMESDVFTYSYTAMILSILFGFVIVILQMNVLVAVVTDSYEEVKDRGEEVFWAERFAYVAELDAIKNALMCGLSCPCQRISSTFPNRIGTWWEDAIWIITGKVESTRWKRYTLCVVFLFILPLWLLVGLATFGLLWPPQVREWLFCPYIIPAHEQNEEEEEICSSLEIDRKANVSNQDTERFEELEAKIKDMHTTINNMNLQFDAMHKILKEKLK